MDKTKKEGFMKRLKILAVVLALGALCMGVLSGCNREWEVYTGEVEGGPLYTLEEIYEARAIRRRDFLNIAYYNGDAERNKWELRNFKPEPFGELSEEISLKMRESMAEDYRDNGTHPDATAENFSVEVYLGCYNGYYAVRFSSDFLIFLEDLFMEEIYSYEVGGIKFTYPYTTRIYLWKEN